MKECIICHQKAGLFRKKTVDGYVCNKCRKYLPRDIKWGTKDYLLGLYEQNKAKEEVFRVTSRFHNMYLDNVNGIFCFSKDKNGEPKTYSDIYYINELKRVGMYCKNAKNVGTNKNDIRCDCVCLVVTKNIDKEYVLARNVRCDFKVAGSKVEWQEPGDFTLFRNIFGEMLKGEYEKWNTYCDTYQNKDNLRAYGCLYLTEDATSDEIKERRNTLIKIFHPDNGKYGNADIARQINDAYEYLQK